MPDNGLTDRQAQVLERVKKGASAREIGEELGVSRNAIYQTIGRLRRDGYLEAADPRVAPASVDEHTFFDNIESFVQASKARLTAIDQRERELHAELDELSGERDQIGDVMKRLEGVSK